MCKTQVSMCNACISEQMSNDHLERCHWHAKLDIADLLAEGYAQSKQYRGSAEHDIAALCSTRRCAIAIKHNRKWKTMLTFSAAHVDATHLSNAQCAMQQHKNTTKWACTRKPSMQQSSAPSVLSMRLPYFFSMRRQRSCSAAATSVLLSRIASFRATRSSTAVPSNWRSLSTYHRNLHMHVRGQRHEVPRRGAVKVALFEHAPEAPAVVP